MHDSELKKLLLETCPVRPGQEDRAWNALREKIYGPARPQAAWSWLSSPAWAGVALGAIALACVLAGFIVGRSQSVAVATADSQSPGIYATTFYSRPAKAQVIWLNGMDPASDKPTYLDPTSAVRIKADKPGPITDPNSL